MWNWTIIEIKQQQNIVGPDGLAIFKPCWNILFKAPYEKEENAQDAFHGCLVWVETNRVKGSEYVITEMFFV